jgi:uncharacterized protein involved in exopolysaccharide biosynthesis
MNHVSYLKKLERQLAASQKTINDLLQELYEVRQQLKQTNPNDSRQATA